MTEMSMGDMLEALEGSLKRIESGEVVKGTVISMNDDEVFVNIGFMADGIISAAELSDESEIRPCDILKVGDEIQVFVLQVNDGEGNVSLSLKRAEYYKVWDQLEDSLNKGTLIQAKVSEIVKGGVVAFIKGVRCFIPASQISINYVENLDIYLDKILEVKVIQLDRENQKIILSRKEVEKIEAEKKGEIVWDTLVIGQKITGVVKRLTKFGAFVDIGGIDGLIHLSEMSWKRILDPSEVVSVGDIVQVNVLDFDKAKGRISLGLKAVEEDPWKLSVDKMAVGNIIEGKIVSIQDFGLFVELEAGVEGLVHISNISEERVTKLSALFKIGDIVKVKIIDMDGKSKRIGLSIKDAVEKEFEDYSNYSNNSNFGNSLGDLFKDKFKDFK